MAQPEWSPVGTINIGDHEEGLDAKLADVPSRIAIEIAMAGSSLILKERLAAYQ